MIKKTLTLLAVLAVILAVPWGVVLAHKLLDGRVIRWITDVFSQYYGWVEHMIGRIL